MKHFIHKFTCSVNVSVRAIVLMILFTFFISCLFSANEVIDEIINEHITEYNKLLESDTISVDEYLEIADFYCSIDLLNIAESVLKQANKSYAENLQIQSYLFDFAYLDSAEAFMNVLTNYNLPDSSSDIEKQVFYEFQKSRVFINSRSIYRKRVKHIEVLTKLVNKYDNVSHIAELIELYNFWSGRIRKLNYDEDLRSTKMINERLLNFELSTGNNKRFVRLCKACIDGKKYPLNFFYKNLFNYYINIGKDESAMDLSENFFKGLKLRAYEKIELLEDFSVFGNYQSNLDTIIDTFIVHFEDEMEERNNSFDNLHDIRFYLSDKNNTSNYNKVLEKHLSKTDNGIQPDVFSAYYYAKKQKFDKSISCLDSIKYMYSNVIASGCGNPPLTVLGRKDEILYGTLKELYAADSLRLIRMLEESFHIRELIVRNADLCMMSKSTDIALKELELYTKVLPKSYFIPYFLGHLHARRLEYKRACHWFNVALIIKPDFRLAIHDLGLLHFAVCDYEKAELFLEKSYYSSIPDSTYRYFTRYDFSSEHPLQVNPQWIDLPDFREAPLILAYGINRKYEMQTELIETAINKYSLLKTNAAMNLEKIKKDKPWLRTDIYKCEQIIENTTRILNTLDCIKAKYNNEYRKCGNNKYRRISFTKKIKRLFTNLLPTKKKEISVTKNDEPLSKLDILNYKIKSRHTIEARNYFFRNQNSLSKFKDYELLCYSLGKLFEENSDFESAMEIYEKGLDLSSLDKVSLDIINYHQNDVKLLHAVAAILAKQGDMETAEVYLNKCLLARDRDDYYARSDHVYDKLLCPDLMYQIKDYKKAETLFKYIRKSLVWSKKSYSSTKFNLFSDNTYDKYAFFYLSYAKFLSEYKKDNEKALELLKEFRKIYTKKNDEVNDMYKILKHKVKK